MARKINCSNGKSFTYLSPKEKYDKYKLELDVGFKMDSNFKPKVKAGYVLQFLTASQRRYREEYISLYEILKNSKSKGSMDFCRDIDNYMKYSSQYRNNKK